MSSFTSFFRRLFSYLGFAANAEFDKRADPRIQLDQAIEEARANHERLSTQAAVVIGNAHHLEIQIGRKVEEVDKLQASTRQALSMAEASRAKGDEKKFLEYTNAAQALAQQLTATESSLEELRSLYESAKVTAEEAKVAVAENAMNFQAKMQEKTALLNQLEQAKMQEKINEARKTMVEGLTAAGATPSFDQIREKIEARAALAKGASDLQNQSVESRIMEVQRAALSSGANSRLEQMRREMGFETVQPVSDATSVQDTAAPVQDTTDPLAN